MGLFLQSVRVHGFRYCGLENNTQIKKEFLLETTELLHKSFSSNHLLIIEIGTLFCRSFSQDVNYEIFMSDKGLASPSSLTLSLQWSLVFVIPQLFCREGNFDVNYSSVDVDLSPLTTKDLKQGEVNPVPCVIKQKTFPSFIFPFFSFHCNIAAKNCYIPIS